MTGHWSPHPGSCPAEGDECLHRGNSGTASGDISWVGFKQQHHFNTKMIIRYWIPIPRRTQNLLWTDWTWELVNLHSFWSNQLFFFFHQCIHVDYIEWVVAVSGKCFYTCVQGRAVTTYNKINRADIAGASKASQYRPVVPRKSPNR